MTHSNQWLQERADLLATVTEWRERAEAAEAKVARRTEALGPFAFTAEWDIDDTESDSQPFRQKDPREAIGGIITVGHFRAALKAMENTDE